MAVLGRRGCHNAPMRPPAAPLRLLLRVLLVLLATTVAGLAGIAPVAGAAPVTAAAQQADGFDPDAALLLAERYVPVVVLKEQEDDCDRTGEAFFPAPVEIVLDNPEVLLRQAGNGDPVVMRGPGARDLFELGDGFFLDFPGLSLSPGCTYERDFRRYTRGVPVTVYAHVVQQDDRPEHVVLQYWFFWYYNDWNNTHEGDWEGIQLVFDASTVEEALTVEPTSVGYAQHEGGARADWNSSTLERVGDRPVVYSSAGSHASYFSSAVYLGRSASEGFGCDDTTGPSLRTDPEMVLLPSAVDDPDDPRAWLAFDGRWGERQSGPFNGPTGPADKDRWARPLDWHDELRSSSVVVPAGDGRGASVVQAFCGVVEWGSLQLIRAKLSPIGALVGLALLVVVARMFVRRTGWDRVAVLPVAARRRAGELVRATPRLYRRYAGTFALIGSVYVPISLVIAGFVRLLQTAPLAGPLFEMGGERGTSSVFLALVVGGLANLFAYNAVSVAVARLAASADAGHPMTAAETLREAWSMWHPLVTALLQAFVVVTLLLVSVIGIPFAVWLTVRYQFVAQAVALDGRAGGGALRRSSQLVRGRWLHTAVVTAAINGAVLVISATVGLLMLLAVRSLPLWMFSVIVNVVAAFIVPLAAIAQTLLYGDAVAEHEGLDLAADDPKTEAVVARPDPVVM